MKRAFVTCSWMSVRYILKCTVTVGNGQELPITHIGSGELCTSSHNFKLDGILWVPNLASNLLPVHKLCLQNNFFFFFAILVLIDFLSRIYLHGRSFTNVWLKMASIHFLHYLLCAHPIPLLILPPKIISLYRLLLILLKFPFGITNLGMQVSNYFILLSNLLIMLLHSIRLMNVVLLVNLV